jgi:hypothetical protein
MSKWAQIFTDKIYCSSIEKEEKAALKLLSHEILNYFSV